MFAHYHWPGNARQLRNQVQRAVAMSVSGGKIEPHHLAPELTQGLFGREHHTGATSVRFGAPGIERLSTAVDRLEREMLQLALDQAAGNISEAARLLGLTRRGLYLKLRRLDLDTPISRDSGVSN